VNFHSNAKDQDTLDINLIPLIDVLLVILIFLAATTTFTRERQLTISLPQSSAEQMTDPNIELSITKDGRFALAGLTTTSTDLLKTLKAHLAGQTDKVVLIRADALTPHQAVVQAMQAAREAGVSKVHFVTQALQ
jgi:biopolymer transport protein ExbD